jgi:hypothetical protein
VRRPITSRRALNYVQRLRGAPLLYFQESRLEAIPFLFGLSRPDLLQEFPHFAPCAIGREVRPVSSRIRPVAHYPLLCCAGSGGGLYAAIARRFHAATRIIIGRRSTVGRGDKPCACAVKQPNESFKILFESAQCVTELFELIAVFHHVGNELDKLVFWLRQ